MEDLEPTLDSPSLLVRRVRWSRWVQSDTLTTGSLDAYCMTADQAGVPTAIFVRCHAPGGPGSMGQSALVDTSFFLFVAR